MIGEFERYHGAAIREILVGANKPIQFRVIDEVGRINSFLIDEKLGIHIKHSAKRLPPWQFTYLDDNFQEIQRIANVSKKVWLIHVCGQDGIVALDIDEYLSINPAGSITTHFVRVDRDRNTMYRINGTAGKLARLKPRGLQRLLDDLVV